MSALQSLQQAAHSSSSFDQDFRELHHFSRPEFASNPTNFSGFVTYCESLVSGTKREGENEQTIERAHRYLELVALGSSHSEAVVQAWEQFPLVTRP